MKDSGFTLPELVAVMVITGILAAIALPKFADRKGFDARGYADQAAFMFRYGQKVAIAQQRPVYVRLDGASVALCFNTTCTAGNRVAPPSGRSAGSAACSSDTTWFCEAPANSVTYSVAPGTAMFYFDGTGTPFDTTNTALTAALVVTVSGGGLNRSFTMERGTGYVH